LIGKPVFSFASIGGISPDPQVDVGAEAVHRYWDI